MDSNGIDQLLSQLRATSSLASGGDAPAAPAAGAADFAALLQSSLEQVNGAQAEAAKLAKQFDQGTANVNLQDVMISLQKANVSFQTMVQVRNRLVQAYHEVMNMPV